MSKALVFIELDVSYCSLSYGVGACPAVLGVDSATKCYNTKGTCPVRLSFDDEPVTLRFAEGTAYLAESGIDAIACIESIAFTPGTISLGEDLGTRSSLRVTMSDFPWSDTGPGFDKYLADRTYDPYRQGTFWGKFRSRHPSLRGRPIRVIRGLLGQTLEEMETRHYVVESVDGPGPDGRYTIIAKDVLKLLDGDRAQAPKMNSGFLNADINNSVTSAQLAPAGIGNADDYPGDFYAAIGGKEIVHVYRDQYAGLDGDTQVALHFDGSDASTTITDSSGNGRNGTCVGNAQLDTADKKFSTASLLLDGTGDYVTLADNAAWTFGGDFTIDCQFKANALPSIAPIFSHQTDANNQYRLHVTSAGALVFSVISASTPLITLTSANGLVATGSWHHVAVAREDDDWAIYLDGVSVATGTGAVTIPNYTSTFRIGSDGAAANFFNGWIDEFRVSSVARWTAAFEAPTAPYNTSSDLLTLTRAQHNTDAVSHKATDRVQVCIDYVSTDISDILYDLMVNYAGVPADYIDLVSWSTETTTFLRTLYTAVIAEPTAVDTLVKELIRQGALAVWWDDEAKKIRLRVLRQIDTTAALFDESVIVKDSLSIADQPTKRLSQVWTYFGQVNALKKVDDTDNYRSCAVVANLEREDDYGSPAIEKIYSRWIPEGGRAIAMRIGEILIGRFGRPPRKFKLNAFKGGPVEPVAAIGCKISAWPLQDATGERIEVPAQVTRLESRSDFYVTEMEEFDFSFVDDGTPTVIFDLDQYNVNARTVFDFFYQEPESGDDIYFIVESGVKIGSKSTSLPAFDMGSWPAGVNIHLIVRGRIQGKGGQGGTYAQGSGPGNPGLVGGVALKTTVPIIMENDPAGEIFGGGGGGGGGGLLTFGAPSYGNGGGGAGFDPGLGATTGVGGANGQPGTTEAGGAGNDPGSGGGGDGGDPGMAGDPGEDGVIGFGGSAGGAGGAAGAAIDGDSLVTYTSAGDIRGPQIG